MLIECKFGRIILIECKFGSVECKNEPEFFYLGFARYGSTRLYARCKDHEGYFDTLEYFKRGIEFKKISRGEFIILSVLKE